MSRRARAPSPGLGAKRAALGVTCALSLALVVALAVRLATPPSIAPPPRVERSEPAELARADALAATGHRLALEGREAMRSDRVRAGVTLHEARRAFEQAAAILEQLLEAHPEEGFEYVAAKVDRLRLELLAVRKLLLELGD